MLTLTLTNGDRLCHVPTGLEGRFDGFADDCFLIVSTPLAHLRSIPVPTEPSPIRVFRTPGRWGLEAPINEWRKLDVDEDPEWLAAWGLPE